METKKREAFEPFCHVSMNNLTVNAKREPQNYVYRLNL